MYQCRLGWFCQLFFIIGNKKCVFSFKRDRDDATFGSINFRRSFVGSEGLVWIRKIFVTAFAFFFFETLNSVFGLSDFHNNFSILFIFDQIFKWARQGSLLLSWQWFFFNPFTQYSVDKVIVPISLFIESNTKLGKCVLTCVPLTS